ncbi:hypothetical protein OG589_25675 [Sphaerisporangium sp. NBC_01403]|uniref:hypothetical protein n=1 Tax=Sphaerisporangium sp. NBC_01403 TaxID=2903599 RepID=UPI003251CEBA
MTAVFALVGLGITLGTAPKLPGSPAPKTDPASSISHPAGPPAGRPAAGPGTGASEVFEQEKIARRGALAASIARIEPPERLWTGFLPAPSTGASPGERERAPGGSYAVSAPAGERPATGREGRRPGDHAAHGAGQNGPGAPQARDRRDERPPAMMDLLPDRPEPPATTPEPRPRRSPPQAPQPSRQPEPPQRPEAVPPRQVPNPCATFTDFRRDYCDQLLGGHGGTR